MQSAGLLRAGGGAWGRGWLVESRPEGSLARAIICRGARVPCGHSRPGGGRRAGWSSHATRGAGGLTKEGKL